jgi:integrase/recombinase XerD
MAEISTLMDLYTRHLENRGLAALSIEAYAQHLRVLFGFLEARGIKDLADVTADAMREYQAFVSEELNHQGRPNSVSTRNNRIRVARFFFRFLREEDYLVTDPAVKMVLAREPKQLPKSILDAAEARRMLKAPDTGTTLGYRDRCILEVLYSSGIRKSETDHLLVEDVDTVGGYVRVNSGKGRKDRVVPLGAIACRYLDNYIRAIRPSLAKKPGEKHLFLSLNGTPMCRSAIWHIVKVYARKAKIPKPISPHSFRHTCATLMLRNNASIRHVQELLGHASLNTTQRYAQLSITDLKAVHARCHPREREGA